MSHEEKITRELRHDGIMYLDFMRILSVALGTKTYFEIGTEFGRSLNAVRCDAVCVDPRFQLEQNFLEGRHRAHFFQMTSDDFFARHDLSVYFPDGADLAFLDGLHHFETLLRDFISTERYCHQKSLVLLHDCLPLNERMAERQYRLDENENSETRDSWTGDVWKLLPILRKYRPDLRLLQFDCGPTGLVGCTKLDPHSRVLSENYQDIVAEFSIITLPGFGLHQLWNQFPTIDTKLLSEISMDMPEILFR